MAKPQATLDDLPSEIAPANLAWLLGLTVQRLGQLEREGVLTKLPSGKYPLASVPDYVRHCRQRGEGLADWSRARTELAKERAQAARIRRLSSDGTLVPAAEVRETWAAIVAVMRTRMLAIPARVAARWGLVRSTIEAAAMVREEVHEALAILSKGTVASTRPLQLEHSIAMGGPTNGRDEQADATDRS
jgi:phage terminase Nu1 subunit (DNA packaging protein)